MNVGKILLAKDWSQKTASKIIRQGNQFVRTKTVVTPMGSTTIKLRGDKVELEGGKLTDIHPIGHWSDKFTEKDAVRILFENFERLFDPKYDAWPAIKKALS